jgi:hypothetical protein
LASKDDDKIIAEARERYAYARDAWAPIFKQMRDDLRFSDPTDLQQWPEDVKRERMNSAGGARPCLTFDQIGQFVRQVVNQARRNRPAMKFIPVDNQSDPELAEVLQGLARQTEYESRADVAYITALDHATRGGLGYFRARTEEVKGANVKGQQCVKIDRVVDPETVLIDPDFREPDGSDAGWGFAQEVMTRKAFEKAYPKAKGSREFDEDGWFSDKHVRIAEYYRVIEQTRNVITAGGRDYSEDEFWEAVQAGTVQPLAEAVRDEKTRVVEHFKLTGEEILERTTFPGEYVPLFPVLGNEQWEDGKRKLSGAVRAARDPQIAYNYERSSAIEAVAMGPKAPWVAPAEAIEGYEGQWANANRGNAAVLPYNSIDEAGNQITPPSRIAPAGMSPGWMGLEERSKADIQAALGQYNASVGNNPNSQSGRAVLALQDKADVGTYHYLDNLGLTISHLGRVLTQVWPVIYDQAQIVRILGEDDEADFVQIDPQAERGYTKGKDQTGREVVVINPSAGKYDVRVTTGPAYMTRQAEAAAEIGELVNGNPQMLAMLGDIWVKMRNIPNADKIARRFEAMLPPEVKAAEDAEDGQQQIPPQVMQVLQQAQQEIQQLQQALQEAQSGVAAKQMETESRERIAAADAESRERIAEHQAQNAYDVQELRGLIEMLKAQIQPPPQLAGDVSKDMREQ